MWGKAAKKLPIRMGRLGKKSKGKLTDKDVPQAESKWNQSYENEKESTREAD